MAIISFINGRGPTCSCKGDISPHVYLTNHPSMDVVVLRYNGFKPLGDPPQHIDPPSRPQVPGDSGEVR